MRKTCVDPFAYSLSLSLECSIYPFHHRSRISIPLGLMLRYSIVPPPTPPRSHSILLFFPPPQTTLILLSLSPSFTSSSSCCCNYPLPLTASRTKHFLIGFRSERTVRFRFARDPACCFCRFYRVSTWLLSFPPRSACLSFERLFISSFEFLIFPSCYPLL